MTAGTLRILRTLPCSPNPSGRATLTKKARTEDVILFTLNERGWKLRSDIRTSTVFCLKGRLGRSCIDTVNVRLNEASINYPEIVQPDEISNAMIIVELKM
ncbi:hypothetical protein AVEN_198288-1 [Araneus ventricosus]|uniref:Uncharacterized protein n=1 Tax=Araneus ventricosus TaxID=182803 RepID=A0A4Y2X2I3_ARAVE|nr:hypothetical protein AVEN_193584-1 [Araneus ventricosus]GBO43713.1 hypothetical protein AVEN_68348-1 [Araneus ventricosus]GBO43715.1 hypothetical protein AVEN_77231-1 [Araneus ventricosus]GBO43720.1 hypothetical protein AVEN_198288-1 [Araneus ventricosus]